LGLNFEYVKYKKHNWIKNVTTTKRERKARGLSQGQVFCQFGIFNKNVKKNNQRSDFS
jgi:hypothetical protein